MKRSMMKDGKMLRECIEQYQFYKSGNNRMVVLTCLRDSRVFVPCRVGHMDDTAFLQRDGKRWLLAFSNPAQQTELPARFQTAEMDFLDVIRAAQFARVDGVLVDPYTVSFALLPEDYDTVSRMITRITSET